MIESRMVPSAPLAGSTMAIKQVIIVRRGCDDRYRSLQATFGVEPIGARIVWDRRQEDRREQKGALILDAYALLIETSAPLTVAPWAETIEDKDYINSWQV